MNTLEQSYQHAMEQIKYWQEFATRIKAEIDINQLRDWCQEQGYPVMEIGDRLDSQTIKEWMQVYRTFWRPHEIEDFCSTEITIAGIRVEDEYHEGVIDPTVSIQGHVYLTGGIPYAVVVRARVMTESETQP